MSLFTLISSKAASNNDVAVAFRNVSPTAGVIRYQSAALAPSASPEPR